MPNYDAALAAYVTLARLSHEKRQLPARDKFLVLAAAAACRAGDLDAAARCRAIILANNPAHQLGRFATVPDALRGDDFSTLLSRLERFCSYERAEHLLRELGIAVSSEDDAAVQRALEGMLSK